MKLIACYELTLDAPLFFANPITHGHEYDLTQSPSPLPDELFGFIGDASIEVAFDGYEFTIVFQLGDAPNPLQRKATVPAVSHMSVSVCTDVDPLDLTDPDRSVPIQTGYLLAMWRLVERLFDYFRYERGFPFLRKLNAQNLSAITWKNQAGETLLNESMAACYVDEFPGLSRDPGSVVGFGSKPIRPSEIKDVQAAIQAPREYAIDAQFRSQARDAIYLEDYRLATVQLAIACEIKVKRIFFGGDAVSSEAFDWLGDQRKVEVSAMDLIGNGSKVVFGESFKDAEPKHFEALEYLFRCRNKVAHRGIAVYRGPKNLVVPVDRNAIEDWWRAVDCVFEWLEAKRKAAI